MNFFFETPSNPLCKISDIANARKVADACGAMLVVDNTFATPYHQCPLVIGADLVVHSATKALGGHNDLMAGAIACNREHYNELWFTRQAIGTTLDAYSASLLERGLKTFELRVQKMAINGMAIAQFLEKHPKVSNLQYPGLETGRLSFRDVFSNGKEFLLFIFMIILIIRNQTIRRAQYSLFAIVK